MTLADSPVKTRELWQRFRPMCNHISNRTDDRFYSVNNYSALEKFSQLTPQTVFEKWATVEVTGFDELPPELEALRLPGGLYAVFIHRGLPSDFPKTARYIFGEWLPASGYRPDHRPHFEILPADYRPDDPLAEEEVWIPIIH